MSEIILQKVNKLHNGKDLARLYNELVAGVLFDKSRRIVFEAINHFFIEGPLNSWDGPMVEIIFILTEKESRTGLIYQSSTIVHFGKTYTILRSNEFIKSPEYYSEFTELEMVELFAPLLTVQSTSGKTITKKTMYEFYRELDFTKMSNKPQKLLEWTYGAKTVLSFFSERYFETEYVGTIKPKRSNEIEDFRENGGTMAELTLISTVFLGIPGEKEVSGYIDGDSQLLFRITSENEINESKLMYNTLFIFQEYEKSYQYNLKIIENGEKL